MATTFIQLLVLFKSIFWVIRDSLEKKRKCVFFRFALTLDITRELYYQS